MTYEEWLKKRQQNQTAGNTGGSSDSPEAAATSQSTDEGMSYEEWMNARAGNGSEELWKQSGIEAMDRDFWAFAKDERRWLEQGAFSRQYSSNAERWRGNIAQERAWLEKYGARLGENAQRISDALDSYEETLNYYDSLYAATAEYEQAGKKISDYITAGVDPSQIDMTGLLQGKANVSSGATVVLATDQYSKAQEQLMQSFQPFTTGTAMDKDNQATLGKEVSGQRARTKMALAWLDQHQGELGEEVYNGLKGYYENTLTQLDLMDSTIQWYADGKSAAVYQDMGSMIQLFQEGKAPTAELAQQEESLYAEVQELQEQVDTWQQQYDDMREAINEGRISEKNLQAAQENLQWARDNLRGYQQLLAQKEQELQEVQEREAFYWAMATNPQTADEDAAAVIERGQIRYADEMGAFNRAWNARADEIVAENPDEELAIPRAEAQAKKEARQRYTVAVDSSHMTEEEKKNFYYLLGSGNDQLAIEYANATSVERRRELMAKWTEHASGANVLPATVAYSLLFPLAGADLLSAGYDVNTGLNQSSDIGPGGIRDAIVQGAVNTLNNDGKMVLPSDIPVLGGKGLGDLYSMALSGAESRGAAMAFGQYATLFLGLSAASSSYNQAVLNGADPEEAKLQAVSSGVFEALFESLSIGQFLDGKVTGSAVKDALIAAGVEASEETMTSIANEIADRMINENQSQWEQTIAQYRKEGMSREEAEDRAWRELLDTIAWDTVAGGLIGGAMGSGQTVQVYRNADAYIAMQNSENAAEQAMYQAAMIAAKVETGDSEEVTRQKVAQWVKEGQKGFGLALKDVVAGRASFEQEAATEAEPEYTGQRYEMAAEEIIDNAREMATEGFTGLGMSQREAEQIANNLDRAIRTGEITDKRIDQMKPTDIRYLAVIEDALNVEIPQAKSIVQARANVRAAIEEARARYLGEATAPAIEIGQEQAEQLRAMSDEELQLQLELERELRDDTSAQPIVRQQAQQALDVLEQEYQRRNGGVKNVQQQKQEAPAPAAKQGKQAERGTQVRNTEPQRNDRVGAGEQSGTVQERNTAQVERGRQGANDQGDRGKGVRKKRDLSRYANIAKTKSTRDYLGKAGAEEVTLGEVTEEYWTDEMRQAAEKAESAGLTVHYVVGSILRANGDRGGGGVYYRGTILASVNDVRFLPEQLVEHEMYHAEATEEATEEILAAIRERYTEEEFERIVREYAEEYEGIIAEGDTQALYEEIAADAAGGMNRFADTGKVAESREQAQEIISRKGREAQRGDRARAPPASPEYDLKWSAENEENVEQAAEDEDAKRPWEIVSDEQHAAAREMGYPVLDGKQVIPFKTWVQATDINPDTGKPWNNYGLVVSNSVTTRQLGVNFWNKNAENGNRTEGNTKFRYVQYQDLHPVQGQYQMTDAEYVSLMESVPEDVVREQIDFMGDNAAEFSKMYEEILWQREQQRLRDEEHGLKLDEAPEGFPWSKKKPLRSSGTRLSPREAAKYLAGATGKEWNIIQDPRRGTWKAVPSARPAGVAKDSEYNRLVKEAKEAGATPMSWKEFSWQKLQENTVKYGEEISTRPVRPEGIAREEFQGTQALRDLGIRISGSVVDYSDTATMRERELALRKMHKAIKKMERALRKNEGAAQLGSRTISMAEDLVEGKKFPEDIPMTLDRRDVIKLAELKMDYKLLGEDLSKKRKLAINRGLVEKAMEMLPDAKELAEDPEAVKAVSLLLLNYGTPEDNMYQIFGDKNGRAEKLYDYYFRTVEENEAEKMRWMNRMFDEASAFRDSKGKKSRLNKAESAYVHVLLDMAGVVQNVDNSKKAKEIKALAEETNKKNTEEAEKIGATLTSVEKEWAEQYARFVAEQAAAKANKKIDQTKCENAAQHYRETFEKLYQALTDLMVTHGLTPLGHIDYYAPHLTINEKSNIMAGFFQELGLKSADGDITEIPADIAGRTQEFKPTKRWTPFLLKRKGTATDYDIVTAYETYLTYVADVLYHHDDILKLRGLETMLRNTANAEWQEQMKELLRVSAYGDINDKVELLQKMGVIDQDYEGEMSPEELLQWLDKNASVEEKHKYLVELGQLMPEEVVTEEQIHALFSELGTKQDEAFAAAVQGLLEDYGLIDSEKRVTAADATDKLNELYEAMASEKRRSEAVRYSSLVNWITNYTNILAGKQYGGDRGAEYNGGRKMVKALSNTVRRYGTAKVVGNLSSVLSQVAQVPLIMAETTTKSQIMALRDIMSQITKENRVQMRGWGDQVDLLTGKKGVQYINTSVGEKITIPMVKLLELMDRFVSVYAARAAYYDALNGKVRGITANDQDAATRYANDFARRIMASRAKGSKPAAFHSKGFFSTMLNMFQVEQLNTVRHMLHDMPREMRRDIREYGVKKGVARYASKMLVYMLAAFLLNRGLDELYGQTPIPFDVPGYILQFIAAGYGVTANDLLTGQGDLKDEFQWGDAAKELLFYELPGDVPFVNNVASIIGYGDQKMPLPDMATIEDVFQSVWKAMTDEGVSGWVAAEAAAKALAEFIPGGSQIKKTVGGISALSRGGTYTDDGRLKWAVDNDPWSVIQNILFGTSSTDEAQRYYARGYGAVSENLTEAYKLLTEQGIDPDDAYDAVYGVKMAWDANEDLSYEEKKQLQRDAIQDSSLDDADKLLLWTYAFGYKDDETGEIVNKDAETFLQLIKADMSWDDIMEMYNYRQALEEDEILEDEAADLQFAHWVETHGYTKEQKAVIVDAYASGEDRYFKLADCGISASDAKALEEAFTAFSKSLEEGKSITTTDKAKIVIGLGMSDADEYRALAAILKSGTLDRLTVATNARITCSTWIEYWTATAQMQNIKDENDEIVMQKKEQVLAYIDGLPLTPEQKDVLYYDQGYAESKIGEAPWN